MSGPESLPPPEGYSHRVRCSDQRYEVWVAPFMLGQYRIRLIARDDSVEWPDILREL